MFSVGIVMLVLFRALEWSKILSQGAQEKKYLGCMYKSLNIVQPNFISV